MNRMGQDLQVGDLTRIGLSRRSLIKGGLGLGALALMGCSANGTDQNSPGNGSSGTSGDLSVAIPDGIYTFDPATTSDIDTIGAINSLLYEGLYRFDPNPPHVEIFPELATDLPEQIDDVTYRIELRENVVFHDGRPFTAEDVVFTVDRYMDPDVASFFTRFFEPIFDSIRAVNPNEIELTLKSPTTLLTHRLGVMKIMSKAAVEESGEVTELKPVGSGPYEIVSAASQEEATLRKFSNYTGTGEYNFDQIAFTVVKEDNARLAGLYNGRFEIVYKAPESAFDELSASSDVDVESIPSQLKTYMLFNCGVAPFDDVRMRQAVLYAIDRDAISEASFFGQAESVWAGDILADDPDYAEPDVVYRYDPDLARKLVQEAGYGDAPAPIELGGGTIDSITSQLPIIQENLREVGFEPTLRLDAKVTEGDFNAMVIISDPSVFAPDAEFRLRWLYYGFVPRELARLGGEEADKIEKVLDQAFTATDDEGRGRFLAEAQSLVQELAPMAPLHRRNNITAWSGEMGGFEPAAGSELLLDGVKSV